MNKILSLIILIIVIVGGLLLVPQVRNYFQNPVSWEQAGSVFQKEMSGVIVGTGRNSIMVKGPVGDEDKKVIEFKITRDTILVNGSNIITKEQIASGKNFKPQFVESSGQISDLVSGIRITKITSDKDLLTNNKVTATEIRYVTIVLPTK